MTADNYLHQVALQYALDVQKEQDENTDPAAVAHIEAIIAFETEWLTADKCYEC